MSQGRNELPTLDAREFARRLKDLLDSGARLAWFLGAGCSVSSGIPAARHLTDQWLHRLKQIQTGSQNDFDQWLIAQFGIVPGQDNRTLYGRVIQELFVTSKHQQTEIENLVVGHDPSFGYAVLAYLLASPKYGEQINLVLTTNFDDLVADALYLYTEKKPLVISHDALANFIRLNPSRPLVVKLHGDSQLEPRNTDEDTQSLSGEVEKRLEAVLSDSGLVFVGYGGRDRSVVKFLQHLEPDALPWGVFWVSSTAPNGGLGDWLQRRNALHVDQRDFDELMLHLSDVFHTPEPSYRRFDSLRRSFYATYSRLIAGRRPGIPRTTLMAGTLKFTPGNANPQRDPGVILGSPSKPVSGHIEISISEKDGYTPTTVYLLEGSTTTWTNRGRLVHSVSQDRAMSDSTDIVSSGHLQPGQAFTLHHQRRITGRSQRIRYFSDVDEDFAEVETNLGLRSEQPIYRGQLIIVGSGTE